MKKIFFATLLFFSLQLICAQEIKDAYPEMDTINETTTDIPFIIIEEPPIFPGCENLGSEDRKFCMQKKMQMHISRKFNTSITDTLSLAEGKYRIIINFRINELGLADSIKVFAPHPLLEREAIRVVNALPKMIPGKLKGEKVAVKYTLPINFYIDKRKRKKKNKRN